MRASPQFQAVWTGTLTTTHQQLVAVLRGQNTAAVSTSGGYIVLPPAPDEVPPASDPNGQASLPSRTSET